MDVNEVLCKLCNITIIGVSRDPTKDSHKVASYLKSKGYTVIPINPSADKIIGEKCYKTLIDIPEDVQRQIEVVDIFMRSENVLHPIMDAIGLKKRHGNLKAVWMQLGIINEKVAKKAEDAGLTVIMDRCMMREHKKISSST